MREAELVTLGSYQGPLQACLTAVKQQGHKAIGRELAQLAAQRVQERWGNAPITSVYSIRPSTAGQRYRGFSLPLMMEKAVVARTGWPGLEKSLAGRFSSGERTSSQGLNLEQRLQRQHRPQHQSSPLGTERLGPLLLLDDVVTTGATLGAAVTTARELGFEPITCFALALADDT